MGKAAIETQFIEIGRNRRMVVMSEEEYDRLLDVIDNIAADRVEKDENDPVLNWEEVSKRLVENRIAEARKSIGMTQKELARRLKVKPSTVCRLERKDTRPRLDTLKRVAKALGVSVHDLI